MSYRLIKQSHLDKCGVGAAVEFMFIDGIYCMLGSI